MANGWAQDGAVQEQIEDSVSDVVALARARLPSGESSEDREDCEGVIREARRKAVPGVRNCVSCQSKRDSRPTVSLFNRRGNKDSQLR